MLLNLATASPQGFWEKHMDLVVDKGGKAIAVLFVLILAWIVSGYASRLITRGMLRAHIDETLSKFLGKLVKWAILLFAVLGCLGMFGVDVTAFAAVVAAAGFAVGLAFQGTLSDFAAGVMLLPSRS